MYSNASSNEKIIGGMILAFRHYKTINRLFCICIKKMIIFENKFYTMVIEKTKKEIIIRLPSSIDMTGLQRFVDYLTYKENTINSIAKQSDIDNLATEVKKGWWTANKTRLLE